MTLFKNAVLIGFALFTLVTFTCTDSSYYPIFFMIMRTNQFTPHDHPSMAFLLMREQAQSHLKFIKICLSNHCEKRSGSGRGYYVCRAICAFYVFQVSFCKQTVQRVLRKCLACNNILYKNNNLITSSVNKHNYFFCYIEVNSIKF